MILAAAAFLAGIMTVQQFTWLPAIPWLVLPGFIALACAYKGYRPAVFFLFGFIWAVYFAQHRLHNRLPAELEGRALALTGEISDLPQQQDSAVRFNFIPKHAQLPKGLRLPKKIRLSWYQPEAEVKAGQHWRFTVKLKRPHGTFNPGGFDYERWLFMNGIGATGYVKKKPAPVLLLSSPAKYTLAYWRQHIADQLTRLNAGNSNTGIIKALIIGDRHDISPAQWQILKITGTIHLVAISGLHIGLIAGLVYFLVLKLWAFTRILKLSPANAAACCAMLAALFYAALAGFSIPTLRALLMLSVVMLAILWQRHISPFNVLALALLAILLFDPFAVLSPGFWLSFLAVVLIIYALSGRRKKLSYTLSLLRITWVTSLGLAPFLLYFFQQVSLLAPLANLLAVPFVSFIIVPLTLITTVLLQFSNDLGTYLLHSVDSCVHALMTLLGLIANSPYADLQRPQPAAWTVFPAMLGVILLLAPKGIPSRWLGCILLLPMLYSKPEGIAKGTFNFTLLDVGQGLSAVVTTTHHVLVFDSGGKFSSGFDMGKSVILPFLQAEGLSHIDTLLISHGDNDHIGGAETLLNSLPVENIISSVPDAFHHRTGIACVKGQQWWWDEVLFEVLSPPSQAFSSANDNSCVLKISSTAGSVLLTGDIERSAEFFLGQTYSGKLQAELLIAPHHGSNTSSTTAFIRAVNPDYILISSGYKNRFGHPHGNVLMRYEAENISWFNTANTGAVLVTHRKDKITLHSQRETHQRYWHWRKE